VEFELTPNNLQQACPTYGLPATCGPQNDMEAFHGRIKIMYKRIVDMNSRCNDIYLRASS